MLWNGRLFYVRISDDQGRALPPRNVIHALLDEIHAKPVQTGMSPLALSYLDSTYLPRNSPSSSTTRRTRRPTTARPRPCSW